MLLVGIITAVSGCTDARGRLTGGRSVELLTALGPIDIFVDADDAAEQFVLSSPAALPVVFLEHPTGATEFRFTWDAFMAREPESAGLIRMS
ncbi:hypothetical protein [Salinibacterium sp. ZJ450]|uniref:hypothetical protein n=1 Tax=Salinibacterium sp. ZJ450 TaxID=2708338 RepID=UPI00174D5A9E|nr:hypothetical protein [Salinibacterium sp. ZJ450]